LRSLPIISAFNKFPDSTIWGNRNPAQRWIVIYRLANNRSIFGFSLII
jgi:hypothetical protein